MFVEVVRRERVHEFPHAIGAQIHRVEHVSAPVDLYRMFDAPPGAGLSNPRSFSACAAVIVADSATIEPRGLPAPRRARSTVSRSVMRPMPDHDVAASRDQCPVAERAQALPAGELFDALPGVVEQHSVTLSPALRRLDVGAHLLLHELTEMVADASDDVGKPWELSARIILKAITL